MVYLKTRGVIARIRAIRRFAPMRLVSWSENLSFDSRSRKESKRLIKKVFCEDGRNLRLKLFWS